MSTAVDVAVIGLGSAGENLAKQLAGLGKRVVGFEPELVGGECPFHACIPSKVLLHHAGVGSSWSDALQARKEATDGLDDRGHADSLTDAGVELVRSRARLGGPNTVVADGRTWTAEHVVLATGSRAATPPIDGIDDGDVWSSARYLTTDTLPESLIVIGGGAVGTEIAVMHRHFGGPVTLLDHSDLLGDDMDLAVRSTLADLLRDREIDVRTSAEIERVRWHRPDGRDGVTVDLTDGSVDADALLVATGQEPRWDGLGLDTIDLDDPSVDDDLRVGGLDWLWAIGDLNGKAPWTHGANHQAEALVDRLTGDAWLDRADVIPHCVFTIPPAAAVGQSVEQARESGIDAVRGEAEFSAIARYATDDIVAGKVVVVADQATGRIIGCSGVGPRMDEIISTATAWIQAGWTVTEASRTVIPFPTMTQVLDVALDDIELD